MPPVDPLNGCMSLFPLLWKRKCPQRAEVAQAVRPMIFVPSLEFQVGSCLYVTAAVKAASHVGTAYVAAAAEVCSRFIGTCGSLRCTYIVHTSTRQVYLGCYNEVWFHRFPSPPFGSPFTFPLHTHFFSSFFSCLPLLHVRSSHSFRSFARTMVRALVCTRTSTFNSGVRSPRSRQ